MTKAQYMFLHQKGYTDEELKDMTNAEAWQIIHDIKQDWEQSSKARQEWLNRVEAIE